jgi:hypothetical protein
LLNADILLLNADILARVTSPSLVNLKVEQDLPQPHLSTFQRAESLWRFNHKAVLVLLDDPADGADDFVDQSPSCTVWGRIRTSRPQSWRGRALG